jgi:hypothetical protein
MHEADDQYEYAGTFSNDEIAKMEAFLRTLTGDTKANRSRS